MTKAELIIKFSNTVGMADADAKVFFEILLKRVSAILKSSQSIYMPQFGYFHIIKGKIKKPALVIGNNEYPEELIDIILYSEEEKLSQSETEGFVFNIPFLDEENYYPVDSFFSLSIGKPLIPLRGVLADKGYVPTSGYEYRRLLESKVEGIIAQSKILTSEEQFPILIIDASSYNSNRVHLESNDKDLELLLSDEQLIDELVPVKTEDNVVRNIAWDFGEKFSKKISAESILELTDERMNNSSQDNATKSESGRELNVGTDEDNILDKLLENENGKEIEGSTESMSDENIVVNQDLDESTIKLELNETDDLLDELNDFEEVKSDNADSINLDDEISDEEFWKSASKLFETYNPHEMRSGKDNNFTEVKSTASNLEDSSSQKNKIILAPENNNEEEITVSDKISEEPAKELPTDDDNIQPVKKGKRWALIFLLILVLSAAAAIYWYTQIYTKSNKDIKVKEPSLTSNNTNIVERNFQIPITYPYPLERTIDEKVLADKESTEEEKKSILNTSNPDIETQKSKSSTNTTDKNGVPAGNPISVGSNIYQYNNVYVVQVASFRSLSIAENEAGRYKNKGFNSFVEPVDIPGRGLWYRIKVGNFSSIDEAKKFLANNIR